MPGIVPSLDSSAIPGVIEANINAYLLSFARLPGATLHRDTRLVWVDSGVADPTFNSVVYANLDREEIDGQIESVLSHFRQRSRPVTWHIGPASRPVDLDRSLIQHGMEHSEDEPGMALELERIQDHVEGPSGLTLEQVRDERGLQEWVSVWLFPVPADVRQICLETLHLRGIGVTLPWRYFLGRLQGKAVATAELFLGEGVAGVQCVVTLPEVRRRGIGAAMTLYVLRQAQAMGYRVAVLTASPDGIGIYRRIGFREYCVFRRYVT